MTAGGQDPTVVEICENLRTVEVEVSIPFVFIVYTLGTDEREWVVQ